MQPVPSHAIQATSRPGRDGSEGGPEEQQIDWLAVASAFVHPLKLAILEEMARSSEPESAVALTRTFAERKQRQWYLTLVSHHLKALEKAGLTVPVKKRQVRGATETFYVLAKKK
jgi:ABC-type transport system involved in cytochrome bd biosynthesis fused ATPase/permease subunit